MSLDDTPSMVQTDEKDITMADDDTLEQYGSIRMKMGNEGDGYYFHSYTRPGAFDFDPELKTAYTQAASGIEAFRSLVDKRITDLGGDPYKYEM